MAAIESKRSVPLAQPSAGKKQKSKRTRRLPTLFKPVITKRGKTTIRRYDGRRFYRFDELMDKTVDFVEIYCAADYHGIDIRFKDKTVLSFVIAPGFTLEAKHSDRKTGNWRSIKKWPLIHSQSHRT